MQKSVLRVARVQVVLTSVELTTAFIDRAGRNPIGVVFVGGAFLTAELCHPGDRQLTSAKK